MKKDTFTVKKISYHEGHDGGGYLHCSLYVNNKETAIVKEDKMGGGYDWDILNQENYQKFSDYVNKLPEYDFNIYMYERNIQQGFHTELPTEVSMMKHSVDGILQDMTEQITKERELNKILKQCETKTIFKDEKGQEYSYPYPFSPKFAEHLKKEEGLNIKVFNINNDWNTTLKDYFDNALSAT